MKTEWSVKGAVRSLDNMDHSFDGFPNAGLDFLRTLNRHNTREWFVGRKQVYEFVESLFQVAA